MTPSDEALYQNLIAGDIAAFDELYRRYEGRLYGYLVRLLGDRSEAEDVLHDAFMAVLRERRSRQELPNFRAWLFQVARNLCHNRMRARRRSARALERVAHSSEPEVHAEQLLAERELPAALDRALEQLPGALVDLYALRAAGLSYHEISDALDVPLGTVKSRMHELIARLREEMQRWLAR